MKSVVYGVIAFAAVLAVWCIFIVVTCWLMAPLIHGADISEFVTDADDPKNWGPVIQRAIDSLRDEGTGWKDSSGGLITFGKGIYPVTSGVTVSCAGVLIRGQGNPYSYSCVIEWKNTDPDAALFTFIAETAKRRRSHGFAMRDMRIVGSKAGTAFAFGPHDRYVTGFCFDRVAVSRMATVFRAQRGKSLGWGGLSCRNCVFIFNGQIVDAAAEVLPGTGGAFNEFSFRTCILSNNGRADQGWPAKYAFEFLANDNGLFSQCIFEKSPRVLWLRQFQQFRMTGCRFENNTSANETDPVVLIEDSSGIWIQAYHRVVPSKEQGPDVPPTVLISNCENYHVEPMSAGKVRIENDWKGRF